MAGLSSNALGKFRIAALCFPNYRSYLADRGRKTKVTKVYRIDQSCCSLESTLHESPELIPYERKEAACVDVPPTPTARPIHERDGR